MMTCPMCGSEIDAPIDCAETGCTAPSDYTVEFECGCIRALCMPHAQYEAAARAAESAEGRSEFMCPRCLQVTTHRETKRVGE